MAEELPVLLEDVPTAPDRGQPVVPPTLVLLVLDALTWPDSPARFQILVLEGTGEAFTLHATTADGTAQDGVHYTGVDADFVIAADGGFIEVATTYGATDDADLEFNLEVTGPAGAIILRASAVGLIRGIGDTTVYETGVYDPGVYD